jgi:hypothetical protein
MLPLCRLDEGEPGGLSGVLCSSTLTEALCFFGEGERGSLKDVAEPFKLSTRTVPLFCFKEGELGTLFGVTVMSALSS